MKIAQIVDKFLPITESWIYSQIVGLQKYHIESEAFCHKIVNQNTHPFSPVYSYKDIPKWQTNYYRTWGKLINQDGATLFWNKYIKKGNFDLIHSHFGWAAQKGIDLAIKNNLPHIATFYGSDITRDPHDANKVLYQEKLPEIFKYSKKMLCTSKFLKNKLLELGADEKKILIWRPGIKVKPQFISKENNLKFQIISVGSLIECKGHKYLIRAIRQVKNKYKNINVSIIGDGPLKKELIKLTESLDLNKNIKFLGSLPHTEVINKICESDIMVHPSIKTPNGKQETLGVVLAEAGLCGIPAIASNIGGIPEIVINNKTGILVKEKNLEYLSNAILKVIFNEDLASYLGSNALNHCNNLFNYNNQINKLVKIYGS